MSPDRGCFWHEQGGHRGQVGTPTPFCSPTHAFTPSPTSSAYPSCREGRRQASTWVGSERARLLSRLSPPSRPSPSRPCPGVPRHLQAWTGPRGALCLQAFTRQCSLRAPLGTAGAGPSVCLPVCLSHSPSCLRGARVRISVQAPGAPSLLSPQGSLSPQQPPPCPHHGPGGSVLSGTLSGTALPTCVNWPS